MLFVTNNDQRLCPNTLQYTLEVQVLLCYACCSRYNYPNDVSSFSYACITGFTLSVHRSNVRVAKADSLSIYTVLVHECDVPRIFFGAGNQSSTFNICLHRGGECQLSIQLHIIVRNTCVINLPTRVSKSRPRLPNAVVGSRPPSPGNSTRLCASPRFEVARALRGCWIGTVAGKSSQEKEI